MLYKAIPQSRATTKLLASMCLAVVLSGCSSIDTQDQYNSETPAVANKANCQSLATLFRESNYNFEQIRYNPSYKDKITLWKTRYQLIENSCQIWQWGDKYSYVCSATFPDRETAHEAYERAQALINQCESNETTDDWYEKQEMLEGRGEETQYLYHGNVRGALRKVNTSGLFKNSWSVYFFIDSPSLLK
ncbi:hypothetical protein [Endozoicomonas ascidiicola]|uniref:hypothetical protein n=1 Tax=Endozoicomonas ascidiicola TaxID=1698521 RepID=UPI00083200B6|nr:hypothetical protein [Endozoicomonas ascidiicola]